MTSQGKQFFVTDASLWVARLVPQDTFHDAVRAWMDSRLAENVELLAPSLLLAEVAGAISRRTGDAGLAQSASSRLETLPGLRIIQMDRALLQDAARLAAGLGLRGADAVYVAVASRLNLPLVTLDSDQRQRAEKHVPIASFPYR